MKISKTKNRKITLWLHAKEEMAAIREGKHTLLLGNYWDFHAGCYGTEMVFADGSKIDFAEEWGENIRGPLPVAEMIARRISATIEIKKRKTPFNC